MKVEFDSRKLSEAIRLASNAMPGPKDVRSVLHAVRLENSSSGVIRATCMDGKLGLAVDTGAGAFEAALCVSRVPETSIKALQAFLHSHQGPIQATLEHGRVVVFEGFTHPEYDPCLDALAGFDPTLRGFDRYVEQDRVLRCTGATTVGAVRNAHRKTVVLTDPTPKRPPRADVYVLGGVLRATAQSVGVGAGTFVLGQADEIPATYLGTFNMARLKDAFIHIPGSSDVVLHFSTFERPDMDTGDMGTTHWFLTFSCPSHGLRGCLMSIRVNPQPDVEAESKLWESWGDQRDQNT